MKKFFFTLLLLTGLSSAFAQAPIIRTLEGEDITNTYQICRAENDEQLYFMQYHFNVCNESSADMVIDFHKTTLVEVEGTANAFCFAGNCVAPGVNEMLGVNIAAGSAAEFISDYMGNGIEGVTQVKYEFTANGETNFVVVSYIIGDYDGLEDMPSLNVEAKLYPNPVESVATFECDLNNNAELHIYSCTGQKVALYQLNQGMNKIDIYADNFNSGLYICSVVMNGQVVATKKMIVK